MEAIAKAARWILCVVSVADRTGSPVAQRWHLCRVAGASVAVWGGVMEAIFITP